MNIFLTKTLQNKNYKIKVFYLLKNHIHNKLVFISLIIILNNKLKKKNY